MIRPGEYIEYKNYGKGFILESYNDTNYYRLLVNFNIHGNKYIKISKSSIRVNNEKLL